MSMSNQDSVKDLGGGDFLYIKW